VKFKSDLNEKFYLAGFGLVGGFGVGSDIMWDVMGGLGYNFTDSISVFGGYRALRDDYSNDGFVNDITQSGPIFSGTFSF
jgi:opacity protein-like surface antigen